MNKRTILALPVLLSVIAAGVVFCISRGEPSGEVQMEDSLRIEMPVVTEVYAAETQACVWVYVSGSVRDPGVYCLDAGARVFEAIDMAGGADADAAQEFLNLAEKVVDGQRIYVPDSKEILPKTGALWQETQAEPGAAEDTLININTASAGQLQSLPGIGTAKAEAIIAYREQHLFEAIEDIMNVSGIKDQLFSRIKDKIKV